MRYIWIVLFFLFVNSAYSQWEEIPLPSMSDNGSISDLEFFSDSIGFLGVKNSPCIYYTTDAGDNWQPLDSNQISFPVDLSSIYSVRFDFVNDQYGYMIAILVSNSQYKKYLYKTDNAGQEWQYVFEFEYQLFDLEFANQENGIVYSGNCKITNDGGQTWDDLDVGNNVLDVYYSDTNRICCLTTDGKCLYSDDLGDNFVEVLSDLSAYCREFTFIDSVAFLLNMNQLLSTNDYGMTWDTVSNDINAAHYVFLATGDTLYFSKSHNGNYVVAASYNSGIESYRQPSSIQSIQFGPFFLWEKTPSFMFTATTRNVLRTSNNGGCLVPNLVGFNGIDLSACPLEQFEITQNPNDSSLLHHWSYNGEIFSYDFYPTWDVPDNYQTGTYLLTYSSAFPEENCFDSTHAYVFLWANPIPPDISAELSSFPNCNNDDEYVMVYPYFSSYSYAISIDTLDNYTSLGGVDFILGDTAFFSMDIDYNENYLVKIWESNDCGDSSKVFPLEKTVEPIHFSDQQVSFSKTVYCYPDTVQVIIENSIEGVKYWLHLFDEDSSVDTIIGNGNEIVFSFPIAFEKRFYVFLETPLGCVSQSSMFIYAVEAPSYDVVSNSYYGFLSDTIQLTPLVSDIIRDSCYWEFSNGFFDTTISCVCDTLEMVFPEDGMWSLDYSYTTINGCKYDSIEFPAIASVFIQGDYTEDAFCMSDIGLPLNKTISVAFDSAGNVYTAGYKLKRNILYGFYSERVPAYFFRKIGPNDSIIWEKEYDKTECNLSPSNYKCSYGTDILPDNNGSVYITGRMDNEDFDFDNIYLNHNLGEFPYGFVAKLDDETSESEWITLFEKDGDVTSYGVSSFGEITILDDRIFLLGDFYSGGKIKRNVTNYTWEELVEIDYAGLYLIEIDTNGYVLSCKQVVNKKNPYYNGYQATSSSYYSFGYGRNAYLNVDKQNRLNIHFIASASWNTRIFGQLVDFPQNYYSQGRSNEWLVVYDPEFGLMNYNLVGNYENVRGSEYNFNNNMLFDSYGNKYILSYWSRLSVFPPTLYEYDGYLWGEYFPSSFNSVSKLDVNCNLIWTRRFDHSLLCDFILTKDEEHIGLSIWQDGSYFGYHDEGTSYGFYGDEEANSLYFQMSSDGEFEVINRYGGELTIPACLLEDSLGYINSHFYSIGPDTTFYETPSGTSFLIDKYGDYDYQAYKVTGENGNCTGLSYDVGLVDTLYLHLSEDFTFCVNDTVLFPWVATSGISSVNLGYILNDDSTEYVFAENIPANEYEYQWVTNIPSGSDSLFFFIESVDSEYFYLSPGFSFNNDQTDLVSLSDTIVCSADLVYFGANFEDYNYSWFPEALFIDNTNDTVGFLPIEDSVSIEILAQNPLNQCYIRDTIDVFYQNDTTQAVINFEVIDSVIVLSNNSSNVTDFDFYLNDIMTDFNDTLILSLEDTTMNCELITYNECTIDSTSLFVFQTRLELCDGDSIQYGGSTYLSGGYDHIVHDSSTLEHIVIHVNESYIMDLFQVQVCEGDSIQIFEQFQSEGGIYEEVLNTVHGCDSILLCELIVNQLPYVDIGNDTILCAHSEFEIICDTSFVNYMWSNGDTVSSVIVDTSWFTSTGFVSIIVEDENGCFINDSIFVTFDPCTFIEESEENTTLKLYPNPARDFIFIEQNSDVCINMIDIFSNDGKLVKRISTYREFDKIWIGELPEGEYFMTLQTDVGRLSFVFVKF